MILLNKAQSVLADNYAINTLGIPSIILMENAARSSSEIISNNVNKNDEICILCGTGNNGGDGFAIARHLKARDFAKISIVAYGNIAKMSHESKLNYEIIKRLNISIYEIISFDEFNSLSKNFDCYIEALIGIGGNEDLRGDIVDILHEVNLRKGFKIAIDVPAGLNIDNGKFHPDAFRADITITMFSPKLGMYLHEASDLCGNIVTAQLGLPYSYLNQFSTVFTYNKQDIRKIIPIRKRNTNKFNYGKVLIIAGSAKYPGAAALTANASVRSGAGLVYLASTEFHQSLFPEVIRINMESNSDGTISSSNFELLEDFVSKVDSIAIGPGVGTNPDTLVLINRLIGILKSKSLVIDADGIRAVSSNHILGSNIVITPHIYEFSKLFDLSPESVSENSLDSAFQYAAKLNCIIHLKSVPAVTSDGEKTILTINGNPGMSSGGSGDVLTGIIASFLGLGLQPFIAASLGAYVHSLAGDMYVEHNSQESLRASDLIEYLSKCF